MNPSSGCGGNKQSPRHCPLLSPHCSGSYLYCLLHQVHLGLMPGKHFLEDKESTVKEPGFARGQTAILSFEIPTAYQVRVPQKVLEAFGVESIHRVLCNRVQRQVTLEIQSHSAKPRTCSVSWIEWNISQNVFPG